MKLTKKKIRGLIREEYKNVLSEMYSPSPEDFIIRNYLIIENDGYGEYPWLWEGKLWDDDTKGSHLFSILQDSLGFDVYEKLQIGSRFGDFIDFLVSSDPSVAQLFDIMDSVGFECFPEGELSIDTGMFSSKDTYLKVQYHIGANQMRLINPMEETGYDEDDNTIQLRFYNIDGSNPPRIFGLADKLDLIKMVASGYQVGYGRHRRPASPSFYLNVDNFSQVLHSRSRFRITVEDNGDGTVEYVLGI